MRKSKEATIESRRDIVNAAAKLLREKGIQGTSVADAMHAAGMTHGGFYRHFQSKDELVAAGTARAFEELFLKAAQFFEQLAPAEAVKAYAMNYLSAEHINNPGKGCPIPALSRDIALEGEKSRKAFSEGVERIITMLAIGMTGNVRRRRAEAAALLSMLVGAVTLARACDGAQANAVLQGSRQCALSVPAARGRL